MRVGVNQLFVDIVLIAATQFDPILENNWKKTKKLQKKQQKNPKKYVLDVFASFLAFSVSLKRIQISNIISTRSAFSASFSKSLIFPIELTLMLVFEKKSK